MKKYEIMEDEEYPVYAACPIEKCTFIRGAVVDLTDEEYAMYCEAMEKYNEVQEMLEDKYEVSKYDH